MAFEGLPEGLMSLIFVKLPVKTLLQCKCVRKSWYSLIKSPKFIQFHRSSSSPQFMFRNCVEGEEPRQHFLSFYSYETFADLGNEINIPFSTRLNYYGELGEVSLSAPCDGLVCLTNHTDQIFICNPALRELRSLFVPPSIGRKSGYYIDSVAFGSDPKTGEYKVVMIGVPYDYSEYYDSDVSDDEFINYYTPEEVDYNDFSNYTPEDDRFGDREARVYDFNTDSWRETAVVVPGPFRYSHRAVSLNGAFHWCPCPEIAGMHHFWDDLNDILTFHISEEVTGSIPLPDFAHQLCMRLFVSRKSQLSLFVAEWGGRYELCVMTEYGVKESWTRLFHFGHRLENYGPFRFWDEQRVLLLTEEGQLVSWDLQHQILRHFPIYGGLDMYPFSESLVSVNVLP